MGEEKKEISRKTLVAIIVVLIIIVVIAFGIIIFFISNGNREIGKSPANKTTSSETALDDNEIINMIDVALYNLNYKYELGFEPNTEQMNEIIDFYKNTSNFDEEKLFNFIGEKGWTIRGTGEIDNSQMENQSSKFSESELKKFIEQRFYHYSNKDYDKIDKIEKYDEDGTGKYIYIVYSQQYITTNGINRYKDCIDICSVDTTQSANEPQVELVSIGDSSYIDRTITQMKSKINWDTSGNLNNSTSSGTLNYKSDTELKMLAFNKWLEQDSYISAQYYYGGNSSCFYTGDITKNADGSVSVYLKLYPDKKLYEDAIKYTGSTNGVGTLGTTTIKLTKIEATR